jgi:hypothetical protein
MRLTARSHIVAHSHVTASHVAYPGPTGESFIMETELSTPRVAK